MQAQLLKVILRSNNSVWKIAKLVFLSLLHGLNLPLFMHVLLSIFGSSRVRKYFSTQKNPPPYVLWICRCNLKNSLAIRRLTFFCLLAGCGVSSQLEIVIALRPCLCGWVVLQLAWNTAGPFMVSTGLVLELLKSLTHLMHRLLLLRFFSWHSLIFSVARVHAQSRVCKIFIRLQPKPI